MAEVYINNPIFLYLCHCICRLVFIDSDFRFVITDPKIPVYHIWQELVDFRKSCPPSWVCRIWLWIRNQRSKKQPCTEFDIKFLKTWFLVDVLRLKKFFGREFRFSDTNYIKIYFWMWKNFPRFRWFSQIFTCFWGQKKMVPW